MQELCDISVADVSVAVPAGNGVEAGMLVLQEDQPPYRRIRMYVAQPEARAIRVAWRSEIPPRPSTWDLFGSTVSLLGGSIAGAVLTDVEDGRHYFAELLLAVPGREDLVHVTARPSDAIAVALRCPGASLQARSHVLDGISRAALPDDEPGRAGEQPGAPVVGGGYPQPVSAPSGPKRAGAGARIVGTRPGHEAVPASASEDDLEAGLVPSGDLDPLEGLDGAGLSEVAGGPAEPA